jgi:general stress protein 26
MWIAHCFDMTNSLRAESRTVDDGSDASSKQLEHLRDVVRQFDTTTLITRRRSGGLHGRPMSVAAVDDDLTVWLVTSASSPKVSEISEDGRVLLSFQRSSQFAALNGRAELVYDRDKIWELWREAYRVWYDGKSDPDIVLLRFTPYDAEYWDSSGAKGIAYLFRAARAYAMGEKLSDDSGMAVDPDYHGKVDLVGPASQPVR